MFRVGFLNYSGSAIPRVTALFSVFHRVFVSQWFLYLKQKSFRSGSNY